MKIFFNLIFIFSMVLFSDELVLGSDNFNQICLNINEYPIFGQSKKEKTNSTEFYIGISFPSLSAPNERIWNRPNSINEISENMYVEYQSLIEANYSFINQRGLILGVLKNIKLSPSFSLSYGVGLNILRYEYTSEEKDIEERIINKIEVIVPPDYKPWIFVETPVNEPFPFRIKTNFNRYSDITVHRTYLLQLPVTLNYLLTEKLYFGISADIKIPLIEDIGGKTIDDITGQEYYKIISQSHVLSKMIANAGMSLKYFLSDRFFTSVQYERSVTNVFQPAAQDYFNNYTPTKVSANSLNILVGYSF